jgi:hypothetical protein
MVGDSKENENFVFAFKLEFLTLFPKYYHINFNQKKSIQKEEACYVSAL